MYEKQMLFILPYSGVQKNSYLLNFFTFITLQPETYIYVIDQHKLHYCEVEGK